MQIDNIITVRETMRPIIKRDSLNAACSVKRDSSGALDLGINHLTLNLQMERALECAVWINSS